MKLMKGYNRIHHAIEIYGADNKVVALFPLPPNDMGQSTDPEAKARQEANAELFIAASAAQP